MQDNRNPHSNLFSRGTTPPSQREPAHEVPAASQIPLAAHPHSISVDSLFRNITTAPPPASTFYSPPPQSHSPQLPPHTSYTPPVVSDGGRSTPLSHHSHHSEGHSNFGGMTSPGPSSNEYRQTALLSLLGPAGPPASSAPNQAPANQQRGPNEASGKMLLEQLMG
jgi:hypothetical protein